jgi:hypothetical protein
MIIKLFNLSGGIGRCGIVDLHGTRYQEQFENGQTRIRDKQLPWKLRLLKWGNNPTSKGNVRITKLTAEILEENQRIHGFQDVAIDFEHNTSPGTEEYKRTFEPRPVAGYGRPQAHPMNGLELCSIQWTALGVKALNEGLYKDLSPSVAVNDNDEVIFVHSVALCRNGAVYNLELDTAQV